MTPDDRVDVLEELEEQRAEEILAEIPAEARRETEELLTYAPDYGRWSHDHRVRAGAGDDDGGRSARERATDRARRQA